METLAQFKVDFISKIDRDTKATLEWGQMGEYEFRLSIGRHDCMVLIRIKTTDLVVYEMSINDMLKSDDAVIVVDLIDEYLKANILATKKLNQIWTT